MRIVLYRHHHRASTEVEVNGALLGFVVELEQGFEALVPGTAPMGASSLEGAVAAVVWAKAHQRARDHAFAAGKSIERAYHHATIEAAPIYTEALAAAEAATVMRRGERETV